MQSLPPSPNLYDLDNPFDESLSYQYFNNEIGFLKKNSFIAEEEMPQPIDFFGDLTTQSRNGGVLKKTIGKEKKQKSNPRRDYKKNICRNILRHAVKSMISNEPCRTYLQSLIPEREQYIEFSHYYNKTLDTITGYRVLKQHLVVCDEDGAEVRMRKSVFRRYLIWFLSSRASVHILLGEVSNQREYLRYKNEILMYYVNQPEEWESNSASWKEVRECEEKKECMFLGGGNVPFT